MGVVAAPEAIGATDGILAIRNAFRRCTLGIIRINEGRVNSRIAVQIEPDQVRADSFVVDTTILDSINERNLRKQQRDKSSATPCIFGWACFASRFPHCRGR